jgi:hypothetical protein
MGLAGCQTPPVREGLAIRLAKVLRNTEMNAELRLN